MLDTGKLLILNRKVLSWWLPAGYDRFPASFQATKEGAKRRAAGRYHIQPFPAALRHRFLLRCEVKLMKIGIVGAGALGLYYGAMLQRSGLDLHFLLRRDYAAIRQNGLRVSSVDGDFHLPQVNCYTHPDQMGPMDLVIVGLKTFANAALPGLLEALIGPTTALLTLQNGLGNEELLADHFGADRVLGGVAFLCSNRGEPGSVHHLGEGKILLGEQAGGLSRRSEHLAELFRNAGVPCRAVADLRRARWEKLVWNIPFNGLCALQQQDVTVLLNHAPSRELIRDLMLEVIAGANAQGLTEPIAPSYSDELLAFSDRMDHYRPSMQLDRHAGQALELDAIYAIPIQLAAAAASPMPRVAMLHSLLALGEPAAIGS